MKYKPTTRYIFWLAAIWIGLSSCSQEVELKPGLIIDSSSRIKLDQYILPAAATLDKPAIQIRGDDIVVDFQHAILQSNGFQNPPDQYTGLAIHVMSGKNITLKNLSVKGFKVGIRADDVTGLKLINIDGSYNYRPKLRSTREREDLGDWMSYHDNDSDEWLRFGAAFYIKNCDSLEVSGCRVTQGQCALMMTGCDEGLIYNNDFHFNSAIGIGLYRSNRNRIMHNRLDWNVRGYSHGVYRRGQDSAGILCYEQSSENTFAYNSATHSGDGFFLWAGNTTIETGEGGCNDNLIYRNDFSHAPTNGVETTFSSNRIIENLLNDCRYGIWAGYSHHSQFIGNQIKDNEFGIAIEHGNHHIIRENYFESDSLGIQLWERSHQPAEWKFVEIWNIESRNYEISQNIFTQVKYPFHLTDTDSVSMMNNRVENAISELFGKDNNALEIRNEESPASHSSMHLSTQNLMEGQVRLIDPLSGGIVPFLDSLELRGIQFIYINEWGPYNFEYPAIFLDDNDPEQMKFSLFGPEGNWKIVGGTGFERINQMTGRFPTNLVAEKIAGAEDFEIRFEFIGEAFTDQFGQEFQKGKIYPFVFRRFDKPFSWEVRWSSYPEELDPVRDYPQWIDWVRDNLSAVNETDQVSYRWWGGPTDAVDPDRFATVASSEAEFERGLYQLIITSDDGLKFYVDGELMIDHWDIHEPATDTLEMELSGNHRFEIEHFEAGGLATLDFRINKKKSPKKDMPDL